MTNEKLRRIINKIELNESEKIYEGIYHVFRNIKNRNFYNGKYSYETHTFEFVVITNGKEKQAIISNMGDDLHWYVLPKYRKKQVLSNALRTGFVKKLWPSLKSVTCCHENGEEYEYDEKYSLTQHLAGIANLELREGI